MNGWLGGQVTRQRRLTVPAPCLQSEREEASRTQPQTLTANGSAGPSEARLESGACAGAQRGREDGFASSLPWRTFSGTKMFGFWGACVSWPLFCGASGGNCSSTRRNGRACFPQSSRYLLHSRANASEVRVAACNQWCEHHCLRFFSAG